MTRGVSPPGVPSGADLAAFIRGGDTCTYLAEQYGTTYDVISSRVHGAGYSTKTGETPGVPFSFKPWQGGALCAQADPEVWFPEQGASTREAKAVCARCTVRQPCLEDALLNQERYGVRGGLSERERRKLTKGAA